MSDADDGGVEEDLNAAARTALIVAMQMGEKFARLREEMAREAQRRDTDAARELSTRFEAERSVARAQLDVLNQPEWWNNATIPDIARLAETATEWKDFEPAAAAASDVIAREVQERHGVDVTTLVADERARASEERTEAVQLIAEADRLDRAANPTEDRDRPRDVIDQLERAGRTPDQDAPRGVDEADNPSEQRAQSAEGDQSLQGSAESTALRADAGNAYDIAERREAYAASLEGAGVSAEDITVRMRASTNQGRPPQDAVSSPSRSGNRTGAPHHVPTRTRERGDRSR
ncbi:hypothetical protein NB037_02200 [Rathayibacter sp. ZW T2_19]|uniref:Colicin import membrane protein n=1 Tax=Rathayibacter rubneri TaxID=2950106 RepID=A0A9X2DU67_9MICO|nr:hypothetical protein [Rathayibacter rubneri]MCM6761220.1 hypothetical protein [Rathayibacter rubneri]